MARWAEIPSATRKCQKHFLAAIRVFANDPGETVAQIATVHESIDHFADDRAPSAVLFGEAFLVNIHKLIEVVFHSSEKRRGFGVARKIDAVDSFRHIRPNSKSGVFANLIDMPSAIRVMDSILIAALSNMPGLSIPIKLIKEQLKLAYPDLSQEFNGKF